MMTPSHFVITATEGDYEDPEYPIAVFTSLEAANAALAFLREENADIHEKNKVAQAAFKAACRERGLSPAFCGQQVAKLAEEFAVGVYELDTLSYDVIEVPVDPQPSEIAAGRRNDA